MKVIAHARNRRGGYTLIELLIVVAIIMTISAMALPSIKDTIANIKTRSAMSEISGLAQDCRSLAVRHSRYKSLHSTTDAQGNMILFTQTFAAGSTPDIDEMQATIDKNLYLPQGFKVASGGSAPAIINPATIWGSGTINLASGDLTFTPRGLPCDSTLTTCTGPRGFIMYFNYTPPGDKTRWIALTVSPAGRIKSFYWNNSNQWGN